MRVCVCVCEGGGGGVLISGANISLLTSYLYAFVHENNTIRILGYVEAFQSPLVD